MGERYPGYDVLAKRHSPSWNAQTRTVIDERLSLDPRTHRFFTDSEWPTIEAICQRIIPQPATRAQPVPLPAMIDEMLFKNRGEGYRDARLPPPNEAWRRGVRALDAESDERYHVRFHQLPPSSQDELLRAIQGDEGRSAAWGEMPPKLFFVARVLHDVVTAYYSHPASWNEIGFGGPAAPRGYVRMSFNRRDPWEAAETRPGVEEEARRDNARIG